MAFYHHTLSIRSVTSFRFALNDANAYGRTCVQRRLQQLTSRGDPDLAAAMAAPRRLSADSAEPRCVAPAPGTASGSIPRMRLLPGCLLPCCLHACNDTCQIMAQKVHVYGSGQPYRWMLQSAVGLLRQAP